MNKFLAIFLTLGLVASAIWINASIHADDVAATQTELHPIAADVLQQLGDDGPFYLHVTIECKADQVDRFLESFDEASDGTRLEAANRQYELIRDASTPTTFRLCEHWTSTEGLSMHLRQPYTDQLLKVLDDCVASPLKLSVFVPLQ